MKQELTQRLIGAVVVTALAAIFIPMLFDDPVDDSSQAVSELSIPKEPVVTIDGTADKLPEDANQVLQATDTEPDQSINNEDSVAGQPGDNEDALPSGPLENEGVGDAQTGTLEGDVVSEEEEFRPSDNDVENDLPASTQSDEPLDTGVVKEAFKPLKKPEKTTPKPTKVENKPYKTVKTPEITAPKQASTAKPLATTSVKPASKPLKSSPELVRWAIQAGSFSKKENALSLFENLRKQGFPVTLETIKTGEKGALYRLKVGPELDKKRALAMKSKLDQQHIKTMLIAE